MVAATMVSFGLFCILAVLMFLFMLLEWHSAVDICVGLMFICGLSAMVCWFIYGLQLFVFN